MMSRKFFSFILLFAALSVHAQIDSSFVVNVENEAVHKYMSEIYYTSAEDDSQLEQYNVAPPSRRDIPNPAIVKLPEVSTDSLILVYSQDSEFTPSDTIGIKPGSTEVNIYNLVPHHFYYYKVENVVENNDESNLSPLLVISGTIEVEGQVRMIYAPSAFNIRDLGGWPTVDGKRIKYEKIYRGSELNGNHIADSIDIAVLLKLGIASEIDMRSSSRDKEAGVSAFGFLDENEVGNDEQYTYLFTDDSGMLRINLYQIKWLNKWKQEFEFIVNCLQNNMPVYEHCVQGADRTGYLSLLLEGLLGVEYDGLVKDYILTNLSEDINREKKNVDEVISYITIMSGSTLQEKFNYFFVNRIGVSQSDIDYFRSEMLEDNIITNVSPSSLLSPPSSFLPGIYNLQGIKIDKTALHHYHGILIEVGSDGTSKLRVIR